MGKWGQRAQIPRYKINKVMDVMYGMVTIVNNTVVTIQTLLRE